MSFPLPSNVQKCREHLVASNRCGDRSPDLRFGVVSGVGRPISSGIPSAQNHFTINITNQPGALIDVGKLNDISSAALHSAPGLLPTPGTQPVPRTNLRPNDLCGAPCFVAPRPLPDNQPPTTGLHWLFLPQPCQRPIPPDFLRRPNAGDAPRAFWRIDS
jgi:hypothetical protein